MKKYYMMKEAMEYMELSRWAIMRAYKSGRLKVQRLNSKTVRFTKKDMDSYMDGGNK